MAAAPTYPAATGPAVIAKSILYANGTDLVDIYDNSGGTVSVRVEDLNVSSTDSAAKTIQFYVHNGTSAFLRASIIITALAGSNGTVLRFDALASIGTLSPDGIRVLEIPEGCKLQARLVAACTNTAGMGIHTTGWARTYA
jgi:hypothetical protein